MIHWKEKQDIITGTPHNDGVSVYFQIIFHKEDDKTDAYLMSVCEHCNVFIDTIVKRTMSKTQSKVTKVTEYKYVAETYLKNISNKLLKIKCPFCKNLLN